MHCKHKVGNGHYLDVFGNILNIFALVIVCFGFCKRRQASLNVVAVKNQGQAYQATQQATYVQQQQQPVQYVQQQPVQYVRQPVRVCPTAACSNHSAAARAVCPAAAGSSRPGHYGKKKKKKKIKFKKLFLCSNR